MTSRLTAGTTLRISARQRRDLYAPTVTVWQPNASNINEKFRHSCCLDRFTGVHLNLFFEPENNSGWPTMVLDVRRLQNPTAPNPPAFSGSVGSRKMQIDLFQILFFCPFQVHSKISSMANDFTSEMSGTTSKVELPARRVFKLRSALVVRSPFWAKQHMVVQYIWQLDWNVPYPPTPSQTPLAHQTHCWWTPATGPPPPADSMTGGSQGGQGRIDEQEVLRWEPWWSQKQKLSLLFPEKPRTSCLDTIPAAIKYMLSWYEFEVNLKKNQGENQRSRLYTCLQLVWWMLQWIYNILCVCFCVFWWGVW